jgi:hypothetical protein
VSGGKGGLLLGLWVLAAEAHFASATIGIWFWSKRGFFKTMGVFFSWARGACFGTERGLASQASKECFWYVRVFALKQGGGILM